MARIYTQRIYAVFSRFERELLEHLVQTAGGDLSSHLREALRLYARELPEFSVQALAKRLDGVAREMKDAEERENLRFELKAFVRSCTEDAPSGVRAVRLPPMQIDSSELAKR